MMQKSFRVFRSTAAAAALCDDDCDVIMRNAISIAQQGERAVDDVGLVFEFEMHDRNWLCFVDLDEGWARIMSSDEFLKSAKTFIQRN
jgi:hypothetical protein